MTRMTMKHCQIHRLHTKNHKRNDQKIEQMKRMISNHLLHLFHLLKNFVFHRALRGEKKIP